MASLIYVSFWGIVRWNDPKVYSYWHVQFKSVLHQDMVEQAKLAKWKWKDNLSRCCRSIQAALLGSHYTSQWPSHSRSRENAGSYNHLGMFSNMQTEADFVRLSDPHAKKHPKGFFMIDNSLASFAFLKEEEMAWARRPQKTKDAQRVGDIFGSAVCGWHSRMLYISFNQSHTTRYPDNIQNETDDQQPDRRI